MPFRDEFVIERDMGCTRAEFMRWLPGATRQAPVEKCGDELKISFGGGCVYIRLNELPPRRIALLSLAVLDVRFRFIDINETARNDFLRYFDLYTRRGGG